MGPGRPVAAVREQVAACSPGLLELVRVAQRDLFRAREGSSRCCWGRGSPSRRDAACTAQMRAPAGRVIPRSSSSTTPTNLTNSTPAGRCRSKPARPRQGRRASPPQAARPKLGSQGHGDNGGRGPHSLRPWLPSPSCHAGAEARQGHIAGCRSGRYPGLVEVDGHTSQCPSSWDGLHPPSEERGSPVGGVRRL